ncbi:MAG: fascin domain-containing protein [Tepidisphaeraceae bacterium]
MKIALSFNGRYVCAENGGDDLGFVHANRLAIGPWETWTVEPLGRAVIALRSVNGRYLCAEDGGGFSVHVNRLAVGAWEQFTLTRPLAENVAVGVRAATGHYLTVDSDALRTLNATATSPVLFVVTILEGASLPRLHVDGLTFRDDGGSPFVWAMTDGWRDYDRYLRGQDIRPVLAESRELGGNGRHVLGMNDWPEHLHPQDHPDYYDRLPAFADLLAEYGQYLQLCVFADTKLVMPDPSQQQVHFRRVCDALRPKSNAVIKLVNENDQHDNGINIGSFAKPDGLLASSGSNGTGNDPPQPFWDYADLGSERRGDFALSTTTLHYAIHGYGTSYPGTHRATVCSEPPGFDEVMIPGRRTNDPAIAYLLGLGCRWGAGGTAHSSDGLQSNPLRPVTKQCVREFLRGVKNGFAL